MADFDQDKPAAASSLRKSNPEILDNQEALQDAINREHIFSGTSASTQTGDHTQGSARCFFTDTAPAMRIDGNNFIETDNGSLWIDTDDNAFYIMTDYSQAVAADKWTPISEELYSVILGQENTWAEIQTFSKTPVVPDVGPAFCPVGSVMIWTTTSAPSGWELCDGSEFSRTVDYDDLFAVIATTYGIGDGSTTFNVPDLRGRVPIGLDAASANLTSPTGASLNESAAGEEEHTLLIGEMPSHDHNIRRQDNSSGVTTTTLEVSTQKSIDDANLIFNTGGGGAHNNMQPYLTLNYIIKF